MDSEIRFEKERMWPVERVEPSALVLEAEERVG